MMKNTIYIIGPKSVFDAEFSQFQQGTGFYFSSGFSNWGAVRYSVDQSQVLLEELEEKFDPAHLARPDVLIFRNTESETADQLVNAYINDQSRINNWNPPSEI